MIDLLRLINPKKGYDRIYDRRGSLRHKHVEQVVLTLNDSCFFRCRTCDCWKNKEHAVPLSANQYDRLFRDLSRIAGEHTLITLTGGEPLMHPEIFEIITSAKKHGLKVSMNTNGFLLNDASLKKLLKTKIDFIVFSVDGSYPALHDGIRGMEGSYERIMSAIGSIGRLKRTEIESRSPSISLCSVISGLNISDAVLIADLADSSRDIDAVWFQAVAPTLFNGKIVSGNLVEDGRTTAIRWYDMEENKDLWPRDSDVINQTYDALVRKKESGSKMTNSIGRLNMHREYFLHPFNGTEMLECTMHKDLIIDPKGDAFHCSIDGSRICNFLNEDISKAWDSKIGRSAKERVAGCRRHCHTILNCGLPKDIRKKEL